MASAGLGDLTRLILKFRKDRDWEKFHDPKDMAISLSLEAAELLEHMQWKNGAELKAALEEKKAELGDELSDVLYWTLLLAHDLEIDLPTAFGAKMKKNAAKYPIAKAYGSNKKYSEL